MSAPTSTCPLECKTKFQHKHSFYIGPFGKKHEKILETKDGHTLNCLFHSLQPPRSAKKCNCDGGEKIVTSGYDSDGIYVLGGQDAIDDDLNVEKRMKMGR